MDNIVESIYKSCDKKNCNNVLVSTLIEFIKPYMPNNSNELVNLQFKLDPNGSDPFIDQDFFEHIMGDWIANIQGADISSSLSDVPLHQSLNTNASELADIQSNNNNTSEFTIEGHIETLKQQLSKAQTELELAQMQLAACEEQNETLLAQLNSRQKCTHREGYSNMCDEILFENEQIQKRAAADKKRCEELEKLVACHEKQKLDLFEKISLLENENATLTKKVTSLERAKRQDRKSLTKMNESLDSKEIEISTLLEVVDDLKSELEEKTYLINFYVNEQKLLKQRNRELESSLKTPYSLMSFPEDSSINDEPFNTPKLVQQLAQPLSPIQSTPKSFNTSTPVKSSSTSVSSKTFDSSNLVGVTLRKPHKSLKEELAESLKDVSNDDRLKKIIREQEEVNDRMWDDMKKLSRENKILLEYKRKYVEQNRALRDFERECEMNMGPNMKVFDVGSQVSSQLHGLETNLTLQKLLDAKMKRKLKSIKRDLSVLQKRPSFFTSPTVNQSNQTDFDEPQGVIKHDLTLLPKKSVVVVNQSTETDNFCDVSRSIITEVKPKRSNYTKQQMKIDSLLEKQDRLEKELTTERKINTKLCSEADSTKKSLDLYEKQLKEKDATVVLLESDRRSLLSQVAELETEMLQLQSDNTNLKSTIEALERRVHYNEDQLVLEAGANREVSLEKELLMNKQCHLEAKVKENAVVQFHLTKQLMDANTVHHLLVKQLRREIAEKKTEIVLMKKKNEMSLEILSLCRNELRRIISNFLDFCKLEGLTLQSQRDFDEFIQNEINENLRSLESQVTTIKSNIEMVAALFQEFCEKHVFEKTSSPAEVDEDDTEFHIDEESFVTASSEISCFLEGLPQFGLLERDSFLDNLQLENVDWRGLSRKELDEKFANFALLLTLDVGTLKTRNTYENDRFHQLTIKFFTYLNYSINLLSNANAAEMNKRRKQATVCLRHLKNISEDIFHVAVKCGVLLYEKRTANCWKSVINYVAMLTQENVQRQKKRRNPCLETKLNSWSIPSSVVRSGAGPQSVVRFCFPGLKFYVYTLFLLFVLCFALIVYIEHLCSQHGKWLCPFQWIMSQFVENTYFNDTHN